MKIVTPNFHDIPLPEELVQEVKKEFLQCVEENEKLIDQVDLARIKEDAADGWYVKRYIHVARYEMNEEKKEAKLKQEKEQIDEVRMEEEGLSDEKKALQEKEKQEKEHKDFIERVVYHMKQTYQARNDNRVNTIAEMGSRELRTEFFTTGEAIPWGPDAEGRLWVIVNAAAIADPVWRESYNRVIIWFYENMARIAIRERRMVNIVWNLQNFDFMKTKNVVLDHRVVINGTMQGLVASNLILGVPAEAKNFFLQTQCDKYGETVRCMLSTSERGLRKLMSNRKGRADRLPSFIGPEYGGFNWRVMPDGVRPLSLIYAEEKVDTSELDAILEEEKKKEVKYGPSPAGDMPLEEYEKLKEKIQQTEELTEGAINPMEVFKDMQAQSMEEKKKAYRKHRLLEQAAQLPNYNKFKSKLVEGLVLKRDVTCLPSGPEAYFSHYLDITK